MTKVELTPAFLIHRRAFKDTSLLLDFFTRDHGKICLVGRGLRSSKTNIQMFQNLNISFSGKSQLKTLTHWEVDDSPRNLKGEALILGLYVNELISRLLHDHDPYFELFEFYKQFVDQVSKSEQADRYWLLRLFENNFLSELGYALDFAQDIGGLPIDKNAFYDYQAQSGFSQNSTGKISGELLDLLLLESLDNIPNKDQLKTCRDLNRQRLNLLLGNKPLKSRELFFTKK